MYYVLDLARDSIRSGHESYSEAQTVAIEQGPSHVVAEQLHPEDTDEDSDDADASHTYHGP